MCGDERTDDYYWLNERQNPTVIAYLEEENNYLERSLGHLKPLREQLLHEMQDRILPADTSVPYFHNGYWYHTRYEATQELPVYCRRRKDLEHNEEVLLDANALAEGKEYFNLGGFEISDDNRYLVFSEDNTGRKQFILRFKDLEDETILEEQLTDTSDDFAWANDNRTLYYVIKDPQTLRPFCVMKHVMGTPVEQDALVYEEPDKAFEVSVAKGRSGKRIFISCCSTTSTEQWMIDAENLQASFELIHPREENLEYYVEDYADELYILTNLGAGNFRVMRTSASSPGKDAWTDLVAPTADFFIDDMQVFRDYIVLQGYKDGLAQVAIFSKEKMTHNFLQFHAHSFTIEPDENPDPETTKLRFTYSSLITPDTTCEADMQTLDIKELKREIFKYYDRERYHTERIWATARDGVKVPITLAYKKGLKKNGKNPILLEGYGAYGVSNDALFNHHRVSLLDRGFIIANAHVRGGYEFGKSWYEEGRQLKKKNTFYDFIDCAEFLIAEGYTRADYFFIEGMSAGGLLVGAVANMRPDLWNTVIAHVPFVDVLTTMLDEELPLTAGEYDEWGDPRIGRFYACMKSYSPYDNVENRKYPAMLVTASFPDSQVQYWEPAKWVARLREHNTGNNPIYLQTDMHASHFGKSGRYDSLELIALQYAFMLDRLDAG